MNFIEIQSWPEVPQIGFFTSLFSSAFNLPDFDIEDLEEALLYDSSENSSINGSTVQEFSPRLVPDLIVALLKGCKLLEKSWPNITASSYQMFLRRIFRHKCEEYNIENPFNTDVDFHSLSLRTKVIILNYLCEFRLDSADAEAITNRFEADSLRIQPIGFDSNDSAYWYFFGTRLYREDSKKKGERIWQVICFSEEDWHNLTKKFKFSKSHKEVDLYKCLTEDFLPNIPDIFKAKETERRRRLFQRRTSSRVKALDRHKNHQSLSYDVEPPLEISDEEETEIKLSFEGKFLIEKNKEKAAKLKIRQRIQRERALRAQRRSSSASSKSSVNFCNKSSSSSNEDSEDNDDINSLKNNSLSFNNNKENILVKKKSLNKFERVAESVDQNFITKMPPVTTKLPGRQTNNSLSSVTGNIVIQATTPNTISTNNSTAITTAAAVASTSTSSTSSSSQQQPQQQPRKKNNNAKSELPKKAPLVSRFMETDEVVQIGMHKVLQQVKNHDDAWPFMDPVEEDIAPRYYSIIKRPMDLMKMEEKLDSGEYLTFAEFRTDFKLIVNNCRLYNGQNNEYTQMVNNIQIAFDRATKKYFDQNSSDEEQVLLEYPPIIEPVNKLKPSTTAIKVQKSDDKKSKHNNSSNSSNNNNNIISNKKTMRSDSSSQEDNNDDDDDEKEISVVEKSNKKIKRKDEKKSSVVVKEKEKNTLRGKRKREKDDSENACKSKKSKKSADHEDIRDNEIISGKKMDIKKSKKIKEKEIVLTELKSNKKSKSKKLVESSPSPSKIIKQKQSKQSKKSSPVKSNKSEKEKLKNNHSNKYFDSSSNMSSDNESIRDLINEDFKTDDDEGGDKKVKNVEDYKKDKLLSNKSISKKQKPIKDIKKSAKSLKKHKKSAKNEEPHHKANKCLEDAFSMSGSERSKSPLIPSIVDDFDSSMERKELSEIKDKYDLIKERRNKHLQQDKSVKSAKESSTGSSNKKEKSSHKDKHVKDKKKEEKMSVFDELLAEKNSENYKQHFGNNEKSKTENVQDELKKPSTKKHSKKDSRKVPTEIKQVVAEVTKQKSSKKQNKASLDVLDMETEQTLKDINKWLEHTPRFEYNSASNSPSRYVIEDIDMHSKIDDNDFRKPIPLMPSSPSTSNKVFHSPTQKDDKILKDTNNKGVQGPSSVASATNAIAIANKKALKESKRKNLKDKLQPAPKKKELQRTIDRLQPGKTKGNLLCNIQNINKPEELFPLGNREKVKEIKSSLTVEPNLSGPQLNLGKVLDSSTFNLYDPKQEKECFSDTEPCERKSLSDSSIKGEDLFDKVENNESKSPNEKDSLKTGDAKVPTDCNNSASDSSNSAKPNLNAWFKAFGMPKKPKSIEEPVKKLVENEAKLESSYTSSRQRKLSTGSSMSERSSVEDSPHVSLDERGGAPAPFPSPIGASPMSASPMSASPKPEENSIQKTNYPINPLNSSTRVGFYQDTTSTKSSPDKSCSPREMLSPYHGHFSQQPNAYANPTNASNTDAYSNFYNPESTNKQRQTSYSKQTNSPTPYYDQYKQPMSQESDFNNSMSPNTNPNSPYHSQQSSPYQQQPNSPYQQTSSGSGTNSANMISTRSPNYSQPNSPYQQNNQAAVSPFNQQQTAQVVSQQPTTTPQTNQQQPNFNNQHYNTLFNQPQQPEITQFSPNAQQQTDSKMPSNPTYNMQQQQKQPPIASAMYNNNNQLQQAPIIAPTKAIPNAANVMSNMQQQQQQQPMMYPESLYVDQNKNRNYGINKKPELQQPPTVAAITPVNEVPRFNAAEQKIDENPKYLDLSKQTNRQHPQYQQAPVATAYSKPEYDKNASYEMLARSMQKNASYAGAMEGCTLPNEISYDAVQKNVPTYGVNSAIPSGSTDSSIKDLTKSASISNLMQNPPASNLMYQAHQAHQTAKTSHPTSMDYKSSPLFNSPSASSMMELTAFMRDFRQADDRFSSFPNPTSGFYDKPITPSHMFGKNISSSASTLQQMFSNPMTTMAYGREQQEYQNRLNAFQAANNTPTPTPVSQMPADNKPKKSKKSKKNASPEVLPPPVASQHPSMAQHQMPTNQQQSHQSQFAMHQQSFQSFAGLKIPSAGSTSSTDPMKSVVPGSAFNYGPSPLGLYGENSPYLDEFRGAQGSYYPPALRSSESTDKTTPNPPQAHPAAPSSPYHHLLPSHHPPRSYPFMNSIDPATLQQQYRMMFNQTYQAGYHLGMHNQPPWHM